LHLEFQLLNTNQRRNVQLCYIKEKEKPILHKETLSIYYLK